MAGRMTSASFVGRQDERRASPRPEGRPSEVADIHATGQQLLDRARESLTRLGTKLPGARADAAGCEAEFAQQVLRQLVEGRTNRQIARTLFISEKTASVHVSNIKGKLGAANRSEAAGGALVPGVTRPDPRPSQ
jgi:DNA-binding NarL/FixJ family response regulator